MWIIGLLGGICSGKSFVAREFERHRAEVFEADRVVHALLDTPNVRDQIVDYFGADVLNSAGRIDRRRLAGRVFGTAPDAVRHRLWLESLLHPLVRQELERMIERSAAAGRWAFVIDAPLLLEANWSTLCHRLIYIDSAEDLRYARGSERGLGPDEIVSREVAQISLNLKKIRADFVIVNSADWQQTTNQVARIVDHLKQSPCL
jgi:dephospho-CoA kinase